ncbi:hypothetical protein ACFL5O_05865 [Myxococcota bacterium]
MQNGKMGDLVDGRAWHGRLRLERFNYFNHFNQGRYGTRAGGGRTCVLVGQPR